jgi:dienelactone hydrolase
MTEKGKGMRTRRWWLFAAAMPCLFWIHAVAASNDAPASVSRGPVSIETFIRQPDFSQVTVSPDGNYVAALVPAANNPYGNMIGILDAKTAKPLYVIKSGAFTLIYNYLWVGNDRIVASLALQQGGLDTPQPTGELFAINLDGSGRFDLFGYRAAGMKTGTHTRQAERRAAAAEIISTKMVGDRQILIAINDFTDDRSGGYTSAALLDVRGGHTVAMGVSPVHNARLVADHAAQVRASYADNDFKGMKLWLRASSKDDWTLVNDGATSGVEMEPIGFNRDNSQLYLRVSHGDQPDAIERMDMATHQLVKLYQGQFADPGQLLPTADGLDYYAVVTDDGKKSLFYFDENAPEAKLNKALADNFPGQLAFFLNFSRDGKHAIVKVISDRNPGDYYVVDLDDRHAHYLLSARQWIEPAKMRPMQPIELKARDGLTLHGFLTLPEGHKPFPLIVLPHGGPYGISDAWAFDPETQLFANRGYAVLQVNYRGSGGYGSQFEQRGYKQWGLRMQDDLTDATHWAIDQGYADAQRICIYGASYGGYAALEGAVREPDLYKCAVGYAGVYDLRVQLDKSDIQETDMGDAYLQVVLGHDREDLLHRSPLGGVARLKADLLLIHGGDDLRVPFKNFKELTDALDKAGKHYESLVEPHEGHGFFLPDHQQQAYQKIMDFIDRHIGAGAPSVASLPASKSAPDSTVSAHP